MLVSPSGQVLAPSLIAMLNQRYMFHDGHTARFTLDTPWGPGSVMRASVGTSVTLTLQKRWVALTWVFEDVTELRVGFRRNESDFHIIWGIRIGFLLGDVYVDFDPNTDEEVLTSTEDLTDSRFYIAAKKVFLSERPITDEELEHNAGWGEK